MSFVPPVSLVSPVSPCVPIWHEDSLFAPDEVRVQVQIPAWLLPVLFFFSLFFFMVFLPFGLSPFILITDSFYLREIFAITNVYFI